jgi:hypothetical protein
MSDDPFDELEDGFRAGFRRLGAAARRLERRIPEPGPSLPQQQGQSQQDKDMGNKPSRSTSYLFGRLSVLFGVACALASMWFHSVVPLAVFVIVWVVLFGFVAGMRR